MKNLFESGVGFRTFLLNQSDENRNKFMKYYIPMSVQQEYRERIAAVDTPVYILGIAEGWCSDCHINLSVLEKLISTNDNIKLRLLTRDDVIGRLTDYEEDGILKVPTFIFMDQGFQPRGSFIERPKSLKGIDKDIRENSKLVDNYIAGKLTDEAAAEMLDLIERTLK